MGVRRSATVASAPAERSCAAGAVVVTPTTVPTPAATCAAVEDSEAGVQALVAAGVGTVVGVTTTAPAAQLRSAGAEATVADLRTPTSLVALGFRGPS